MSGLLDSSQNRKCRPHYIFHPSIMYTEVCEIVLVTIFTAQCTTSCTYEYIYILSVHACSRIAILQGKGAIASVRNSHEESNSLMCCVLTMRFSLKLASDKKEIGLRSGEFEVTSLTN